MSERTKRREAGRRAFPKDTRPALRLVRPPVECTTTDLILDAPRAVKELLRDMNRKRKVVRDTGGSEAA